MAGGIKAPCHLEGREPGLPAALINHAPLAPAGITVVEALVCRAHRDLARLLRLGVKALEILQCHRIGWTSGLRGDPGISSIGIVIGKRARVAKKEQGCQGKAVAHALPVDWIFFQAEEKDCWMPVEANIGG